VLKSFVNIFSVILERDFYKEGYNLPEFGRK